MSVLSRLVLSLLLLGALLIPAAAEAAVTPTGEEDVVRWNRPFRPDGSKLPKVTRKARATCASSSPPACAGSTAKIP